MDVLRLKAVLLEKGVTGKELAERVGVSSVAISNIASGNSFPKPELLKKIAKELDIDIRELFNPTKEEDTSEPIYVQRNDRFIRIGELKISND